MKSAVNIQMEIDQGLPVSSVVMNLIKILNPLSPSQWMLAVGRKFICNSNEMEKSASPTMTTASGVSKEICARKTKEARRNAGTSENSSP